MDDKKIDHFSKYHFVGSASELFKDSLCRWVEDNRSFAPLQVIDIGCGDGKQFETLLKEVNCPLDLWSLDLEGIDGDNTIAHDICMDVPEAYRKKFDILYSYNAFEHFKNPLVAADNCANMLRNGGICLVHTVFSWRYHPVPSDYFRFSDDALRYMFEERNGIETIHCGYDLSNRRMDIRGGYFGDQDIPPIDEFGGFRENWGVFYIGLRQ